MTRAPVCPFSSSIPASPRTATSISRTAPHRFLSVGARNVPSPRKCTRRRGGGLEEVSSCSTGGTPAPLPSPPRQCALGNAPSMVLFAPMEGGVARLEEGSNCFAAGREIPLDFKKGPVWLALEKAGQHTTRPGVWGRRAAQTLPLFGSIEEYIA